MAEKIKLIAALGNPGSRYQFTRHNAGFLALDFFIKHSEIEFAKSDKFQSHLFSAKVEDAKIIAIKPQTFMNLSGEAVNQACNFYKINPEKNLLVIHDEVDLQLGHVRLANNSSHAGHNGVRNIFEELGTKNIQRLRIGIESRSNRQQIPTDAFVLQNFSDNELSQMLGIFKNKVSQIIEDFINS